MAILVMDTATEALAVAVGNEGKVIAESVFRVPRGHSRILQPAIAHLLSHTGIGMDNIAGIAVGVGPGSYTGVRLAVSTAKAMAVTLSVPLYPVSTLFGIAGAAILGQPVRPTVIMPLLFARRGRAFGALYLKKRDKSFELIKGSTVMPVQDWCNVAVETVRTMHDQVYDKDKVALQSEAFDTTGKQGNIPTDLVVIHDFLPKHGVLNLLNLLETDSVTRFSTSVTPLSTVAAGISASIFHLVSSGLVPSVTGDAVHNIVPEYALEVEAVAKLRQS